MHKRQLEAIAAFRHRALAPVHIHRHPFSQGLTRSQLLGAATGMAAGALTIGAAWKTRSAEARTPSDPRPIPAGSPLLGGSFRLFGPTPDGSFDPIDAEPIVIDDFQGSFGLAYVSGMCTR